MLIKKYGNAIIFIFLLTLLISTNAFAQNATEILKQVDNTQKNFNTMSFTGAMKITSGSRNLEKSFFGFLDDSKDSSFMEYTNPSDNGIRYLKLGQDMWIYIPDAGDVLKLSGHLLRDSMMGSDISYDDMLDQGNLSDNYNAESVTSTNLDGKDVYLLVIKKKEGSTVNYERQDLYVDKNNYLINKMVMYAKGRETDRAIKEFILTDYKKYGNLNMATKLVVRDLRKRNSSTTITYDKIEINSQIDKKVFTRSYLEE